VKIADIPAWIARRDKTPMGIIKVVFEVSLKRISLTKNK